MGASANARAAAIALMVALTACSGGGGEPRAGGAASPTTEPTMTAPTAPTTQPSMSEGSPTPGAPSKPGPGGGTQAPAPSPPEGVSTLKANEREFAYSLRRDGRAFMGRHAPMVAVQRLEGDTMTIRWRFKYDSMETERTMRAAGVSWSGAFFEDTAIEWTDCAWSPAITYVPELRVGARVPLDTRCEVEWEDGANPHYHLTGEVKVTGQKTVTIMGEPYKVWVIERAYRLEASGGTTGTGEFTTNALWSPDLKMMVRQDANGQATVAGETASNTAHIEIEGLKE